MRVEKVGKIVTAQLELHDPQQSKSSNCPRKSLRYASRMSNPAIQVAETIQTASINRAPSPHHDINPSTAASQKEPVTLSRLPGDGSASDSDEIPDYIVNERPRRATLPPLPDLRFEQSYLKSIEGRDQFGVAWITIRDQVVLPLVQGMLWTLALQGWRTWNRGANYSGRTAGCE